MTPTITTLTDQMELFAKKRMAALDRDTRDLVETLAMIETLRINTLDPEKLIAKLRGGAMARQYRSAIIGTHMDMIADQYATLNSQTEGTLQ